jgi:nucleoside-diphosphate-sugar epimerase/glycosyltransferase involved in cell wall biosynthesis
MEGLESMKILVTGGGGFIGAYFARALQGAGHEPVLMDIFPPDVPDHRRIWICGDIRDVQDVDAAIQGCEAVLHLAAAHHDFGIDERTFEQVNVLGARNLCAAMDRRGIRNVCFFSSVAVFGRATPPLDESTIPEPVSHYGRTKWQAEQLFANWAQQDKERQCLVIRPSVTFGPGNYANMYSLIRQIDNGRFAQVGRGDNIKSISYVENLVSATMQMWLDPRYQQAGLRVFNYVDKPDLTSRQIVHAIRAALRKHGFHWTIPYWFARTLAFPADVLIRLTGMNLRISGARIRKLAREETKFESDRIRHAGYRQEISTEEGIRRMVEWYLQEGFVVRPPEMRERRPPAIAASVSNMPATQGQGTAKTAAVDLSCRSAQVSNGRAYESPCLGRLLFINRSYWPDAEATGQLLTELCEDLAAHWDVHVICGQPVHNLDDESFHTRGPCKRHGVVIHRVRHSQFPKKSTVGRISNMVTFFLAASYRALRVPRPDVIIAETDPPMLCLLGLAVRTIRRTRFVCYLQDIYPDVAVALGKLAEGFVSRLLRRLFLMAYRHADAVVVLSRDMQRLLQSHLGPDANLHVIPNWVDTSLVRPTKGDNRFRIQHGFEERFVVMYSGNLGLSQRFGDVLDAAQALRDDDKFLFVFVGDGVQGDSLKRQVADRNLHNVKFLGYQPKQDLSQSLSAADVQLVLLAPEVSQCLMPSKVYGVLASGTPMIVVAALDTELAQLCLEYHVGNVVAPSDPGGLAQAIRKMANDRAALVQQGVAARNLAQSRFDRAIVVRLFSELLRSTVRPRTHAGQAGGLVSTSENPS